jgi:hypothetical protein
VPDYLYKTKKGVQSTPFYLANKGLTDPFAA